MLSSWFKREDPSYTHTAHYRISAKALIWNEERTKIVLCREDNNRWDFPGGGIEHGHSIEETIRKELHEEMGVVVTYVAKAPSAFLTQKFSDSPKHFANVFYETKVADLLITPSRECEEVGFFDAESVKSINCYSNILTFFAENWERLMKK